MQSIPKKRSRAEAQLPKTGSDNLKAATDWLGRPHRGFSLQTAHADLDWSLIYLQTSALRLKHPNGRPNPDQRPHGNVRLNRAKLPPPPVSSGLVRFPRPTTSSGMKLGSHRRRLFGSDLRHPPWEEGAQIIPPNTEEQLKCARPRNEKWLENKKDTYTYNRWQEIIMDNCAFKKTFGGES